jgi:large subunit ribosomal protein L29
MKIKELREKTDAELNMEHAKLVKEYQDMKFKKVVSVVENPIRLRFIKRELATIKTLLHERSLAKIKQQIEKA